MIFDKIEHLKRYNVPFCEDILKFLKAHDPAALPVGEMEILGRDLFVRPSEYDTKPASEGKFETHRVYADLQYVVGGEEIMQVAPIDTLTPLSAYDEKGDYQFFTAAGSISSSLVRAGEFTVFWPGEAHRPCCTPAERPVRVKKLVFKIRMG